MRTCLLVLVALALGGCAPAAPTRPADIAGLVTNVGAGTRTILVEESRDPSTGAKASVTIDGSTRIWTLAGQTFTRAAPDALRVGSSVRVWFDGPVAASYPVQGRAADIAIAASSGAERLDVLSKGGPTVVVRVNGVDAARVACNSGDVIFAADLPRWMLVTQATVGISEQAIAGPYVAC